MQRIGYGTQPGLVIPLGCNVESVSLKKEEIEASVELVRRVAHLLGREASPQSSVSPP